MKQGVILLVFLILLTPLVVVGQGAELGETYEGQGIRFSYPSGWIVDADEDSVRIGDYDTWVKNMEFNISPEISTGAFAIQAFGAAGLEALDFESASLVSGESEYALGYLSGFTILADLAELSTEVAEIDIGVPTHTSAGKYEAIYTITTVVNDRFFMLLLENGIPIAEIRAISHGGEMESWLSLIFEMAGTIVISDQANVQDGSSSALPNQDMLSPDQTLVGVWENQDPNYPFAYFANIGFYSDGTVTLTMPEGRLSGTYSIDGDSQMRMDLVFQYQSVEQRVYDFSYELTGDSLTLTGGITPDMVGAYRRIRTFSEDDSVACPDSQPSNMLLGFLGRVNDVQGTVAELRTEPSTQASIIETLSEGIPFGVVGGPRCNEGMTWWQVQIKDTGLRGWMAEGSGGHYNITPEPTPIGSVYRSRWCSELLETHSVSDLSVGLQGRVLSNSVELLSDPQTFPHVIPGIYSLRTLESGTVFDVVDGPGCVAEEEIYWFVRLEDGLMGWISDRVVSGQRDFSNRYVVFLHGITSSSSNSDPSVQRSFENISEGLRTIGINPSNFVYFSYGAAAGYEVGDLYCGGWGNEGCSTSTLGDLASLNLTPIYDAEDTKLPVDQQMQALDWLLHEIIKNDPSAQIDLIGYSLGGVIASRWASQVTDTSELIPHIHSIVLIESPVGGIFPAEAILKPAPEGFLTTLGVGLIIQDIFGLNVLRDLQIPTSGSDENEESIVASLEGAARRFPVTSIQSSSDYLVNGEALLIETVERLHTLIIGQGSQLWNAPHTFHRINDLGRRGVDEVSVSEVETVLRTNHAAPLNQPETVEWVISAIEAE